MVACMPRRKKVGAKPKRKKEAKEEKTKKERTRKKVDRQRRRLMVAIGRDIVDEAEVGSAPGELASGSCSSSSSSRSPGFRVKQKALEAAREAKRLLRAAEAISTVDRVDPGAASSSRAGGQATVPALSTAVGASAPATIAPAAAAQRLPEEHHVQQTARLKALQAHVR